MEESPDVGPFRAPAERFQIPGQEVNAVRIVNLTV